MFRLKYLMLVVLVVVSLQTAKKLINPSSGSGANWRSGLLPFSSRLRYPLINLAIFVIWFWISFHRRCEDYCAISLQSPSEDYENALSSTLTTHVARFSAVGVNQWSLMNLCDTPDWSAALPTIFMEFKPGRTSAHICPTGTASQVVIILSPGVIIINAFPPTILFQFQFSFFLAFGFFKISCGLLESPIWKVCCTQTGKFVFCLFFMFKQNSVG